MKWYRAAAVFGMVALAACQPPKPGVPKNAQTPGDTGDPSLAAAVAVPDYNLGDVDVAVILTEQLSERSRSQHIEYNEVEVPLRKTISLANATVNQPYPSELWVKTTVHSPRGFRPTDTVLLRVSILAEGKTEPLLKKDIVWSGTAMTGRPETFEVDLIPALKPLPASTLIKAQAKIVWFPNTDPLTITPETADDSKGQVLEKNSNPLRIDFK